MAFSLENFKEQFAPRKNWAHFNNAGQCMIPKNNVQSAKHWLDRFHFEGGACIAQAWESAEHTRALLANFLGGKKEELGFFQTTAAALSQAAAAVPLEKGDEILTWQSEYPSNFYPWRMAAERTGAHLIQLPTENGATPFEKILARVNQKTKAIAVSWVQYQNGAVTDLAALAHALKGLGIWLIADVIQGAGVRPLNFNESGFDILCGGSHKWLCSGYGAAFMLAREERLPKMRPLEYGAMTFGNPNTEKSFHILPKTDASKFEPGSKAIIEVIAMQESLELFQSTGMNVIFAEARRLADRLRTGLRDLGFSVFDDRGAIVNFAPQNLSERESIYKKLLAARVDCVPRAQGIRLSVHAYNTDEEVDYTLSLF